jgi:hypothetical protein
MTVLGDFQTIIGDERQSVPVAGSGAEVPLGQNFNTGGRIAGTLESGPEQGGRSAFLIYSVRFMVGTAQVFVNDSDQSVGTITPSSGTAWFTQLIAMAGSRLNDGNNRITLRNVTDAFEIKDLICFFHQSS